MLGRGECLALQAQGVRLLHRLAVLLKGGVTAVEEMVEDHPDAVKIDGVIQIGHDIRQLRGAVAAAVVLRQGGDGQVLQGGQAQVADGKTAVFIHKNIFRLQILMNIPGLPDPGQGVAEVDAQIQRLQVRHRVRLQIGVQRRAVRRQKVKVVPDGPLLPLNQLEAGEQREILQPAELLPVADLDGL